MTPRFPSLPLAIAAALLIGAVLAHALRAADAPPRDLPKRPAQCTCIDYPPHRGFGPSTVCTEDQQ